MLKLLLIEDNQCDAMLLLRQLKHWFGDVECICIECLSQLSDYWQDDIDVVITDANLPDAQIIDIVDVLRNLGMTCPYIITSGAIDDLPLQDLCLEHAGLIGKGDWSALNDVLVRLQLIH